MNFIAPDWLYLLMIPLILMPILALMGRSKRRKILTALLGTNADSPEAVHLSRGRRFWRILLLCLCVVFIIAACARPFFHARLLPFEAKGRDLLVLCDVSRSMNATDIAPSRLQHARYLLHQLSSHDKGDRLGLILFAGNAYLSCPLTSDPVTFDEYVDDISTDSVPAGGTNLEKALQTALKAFESSESGNRAVILLTDGEELTGSIKAAEAELIKRRIPVFAIGFGDPVNGAVIPQAPGGSALVRDAQGKIVTTRLNEKLLSSLAAATKGIYIRTTAADSGFPQLQSAIDALDRRSREKEKQNLPVEEFPKALAAALGALLLFLLLSERKSPSSGVTVFLLCALIWGAAAPELAGAEKKVTSSPPVTAPPKSSEAAYNLARKLQKSGKQGYEEIYRKLIAELPVTAPLRAKSFLNLGVGLHNRSRDLTKTIRQQLQQQRPAEALKTIGESLNFSRGAEELYSSSAAGGPEPPRVLGANLNTLFRERKALEELKKKIEELLKQQQKAQNQTSSAQQQNRSTPQNQQQRRQQQNAIDKAQQQSRQLQQQAQQLQQSQMSKAAQKASEELKKASEAKKRGEDKQSGKHIDNALRELARQSPSQQQDQNKGGKKQNSPQPQEQAKQDQPQKGSPSPQQMKDPADRRGAEQMLEMMGEDDKKLRSAIKRQMRMKRQQTERDW